MSVQSEARLWRDGSIAGDGDMNGTCSVQSTVDVITPGNAFQQKVSMSMNSRLNQETIF